jgi:extracellular elastinolytic metalloproteinase
MPFQFMTRILSLFLFLTLATTSVWAQTSSQDLAMAHLRENAPKWGLQSGDINALKLQKITPSANGLVEHVYFIQQYKGVEIYNAIYNATIKNGKVIHAGNRLVADVANKAMGSKNPNINAFEAINSALVIVGGQPEQPTRLMDAQAASYLTYAPISQTSAPVLVRLMWTPSQDGTLQLAWEVGLEMKDQMDFWAIQVSAADGSLVAKNSWTTHCSHGNQHPGVAHSAACYDAETSVKTTNNNTDGATYRVFPWPLESPNHGPIQLVTEPSNPSASPLGWHDTNNATGPEYMTTRGNNVNAYLDQNSDNSADEVAPNGTSTLTFDFPWDYLMEPIDNKSSAQVNLFYVNNMMHDYLHVHGFDEQSGNFQQNNYGNGGSGNDAVQAEALDGSTLATPNLNNANFSTPPDGISGRMQMYRWNSSISKIVHIDAPAALAGTSFEAGTAQFGPILNATPVSGALQIVNDGTDAPTQGCFAPLIETLTGKIAVVDRGNCFFSEKVYFAQQAGAIAVIVCNFGSEVMGMAGSTWAADVTIPSVFMSNGDCNTLKSLIDEGLEISLFVDATVSIPESVDASFDAGIIGHEYGHGISTRLTGGGNTGCLSNADQMGEGYGDFFGLISTMNPAVDGTFPRGVGTFVQRQGVDGGGIRRYKYTPDMTIDPLTYADIPAGPTSGSSIYNIGELWTSVLWDLVWELSAEYGFEPDFMAQTGGNNIAINLVIEGLKIQPCNPGLIDARDAILAADEALYDGANQCLIWDAFARRGMGFNASQGSNDAPGDAVASFESRPECTYALDFKKEMQAGVDPGEEFSVKLTISNYKAETATGVSLADVIPTGATYVAGSAVLGVDGTGDITPTQTGNELIFALNDMASGDIVTITYMLLASEDIVSTTTFFDDYEQGEINWIYESLDPISNFWSQIDLFAFSGNNSFGVASLDTNCDETLHFVTPKGVEGSFPALRFYGQYDTEAGYDGGLVQLKQGAGAWTNLGTKMLRGGYNRGLEYSTFAIPNVRAWSGNSNGFKESIVDLSDWNNMDVDIRWRFATNNAVQQGTGWFVDNVELMDMRNYNSEACLTDNNGTSVCKVASEHGTVVTSTAYIIGTEDQIIDLGMTAQPNPASNETLVTLNGANESVKLTLYTLDGRVMTDLGTQSGISRFKLDTTTLPDGIYLLQGSSKSGQQSIKIVVQH